MPGRDFFVRMASAFAEHAGSARENADRQASVERLISKAEYECVQVRRELEGLVAFPEPPSAPELRAAPMFTEAATETTFVPPALADAKAA